MSHQPQPYPKWIYSELLGHDFVVEDEKQHLLHTTTPAHAEKPEAARMSDPDLEEHASEGFAQVLSPKGAVKPRRSSKKKSQGD